MPAFIDVRLRDDCLGYGTSSFKQIPLNSNTGIFVVVVVVVDEI